MATKKEQNLNRTVVFVSHAHEDAPFAAAIQDWLEKNINVGFDFIKVFASSNKASVQVGDVWFDKLRENLKRSSICICLVTPHSIERRWLYFESGAAFFKDVPVVPICLGGVGVRDLQPPLYFSNAVELPSEEGELNLLMLVAQKTCRKDLPERPTRLRLPEFRYSASSDWQFSVESLAALERTFTGRTVWVVSADLGLDVVNGPMAGPVSDNLSRGVSYTYLVPNRDELKTVIESIQTAYHESNRSPKFIYLRPDYFGLGEINLTIYNPIAEVGAPTEVFMELPIDSDPRERRWIRMDETLAKRLVARVRPLIEEPNLGGSAPGAG